ncbi:hypothetical protein BO94DRAFT_540301 [Aspergillus sclerotioniger CBS 115572]|uniref:Uncharacterized protein n=1 Tax=Aspergillus sclerotioniger CBS 115572 TaxID=1450535 RepID=A0A317V5E1_9EURO|nr:hypothetical protein BO94DRAFT_540301 [Aspergillus sclerotioniger CBS 115572]PWY68107.1 hypothetical protein BO94DRAFT_540301 [Aspergillus sclerotioniger CBS 115572]
MASAHQDNFTIDPSVLYNEAPLGNHHSEPMRGTNNQEREGQDGKQGERKGDEECCPPSVEPIRMIIRGHIFNLDNGVPEHIQDELWALFGKKKLTSEKIPEHLKAYGYTAEQFEQFAKEDAKYGKMALEG